MAAGLSVVYSTRQWEESFRCHLVQTCGIVGVEILGYLNDGQVALSKLYNQGLEAAKNDIIVFLHDDVVFESDDWGRRIVEHFANSEFGILGVAGTTELSKTGVWWQNPRRTVGLLKHRSEDRIWSSGYSGDFKQRIIAVVGVDGVLLAVHRKRLREGFSEELLGFHFYDLDFCINNYLAGVKIGVIFNVPVVHHSVGPLAEVWEHCRQQFCLMHRYHLPCALPPGEVIFQVKSLSWSRTPRVTVIILTKSNNALLFNCINSFAEKSVYPNYEIVIADTGSSADELAEIEALVEASRLQIKLMKFEDYHFARVNNVVGKEGGELLLFCNNDIELINDVLGHLVEVYLQNEANCGTVGCRLYFADHTIQHAGIVLNEQFEVGHRGWGSYYGFSPEGAESGVTGVTGACLLIARSLFEEVGGFNEEYLDCLEDVELNLVCAERGRVNWLVNDAVAYHFESQTRQSKSIGAADYDRFRKRFAKRE